MAKQTSMEADATAWLKEVGLATSKDPLVSLMLDACRTLDQAAKGDVPHVVANNARAALHKARQSIQKQLEQTDSLVSRHRFEVLFGGLAARTLGYVDVNLLSDKTRRLITRELADRHNIKIATPTEKLLD